MKVIRRDAVRGRGFGFYRGRGCGRARFEIGGMIYRQFESHRASPLFFSGYILPDYLTGVKSIDRKVSREKTDCCLNGRLYITSILFSSEKLF
jgi:hypothetical protein